MVMHSSYRVRFIIDTVPPFRPNARLSVQYWRTEPTLATIQALGCIDRRHGVCRSPSVFCPIPIGRAVCLCVLCVQFLSSAFRFTFLIDTQYSEREVQRSGIPRRCSQQRPRRSVQRRSDSGLLHPVHHPPGPERSLCIPSFDLALAKVL